MSDPVRDIFEYPVTEPFGVFGPFGEKHTGVDLGLPAGTPVPAEGSGTVESVFADAYGGKQVKIKYASGAEGWFAHLLSVFVQPGQHVDPNTEIALSGASGRVTGPHLHFEERDPWGTLIDPMTPQAHTYIGGIADSPPQKDNRGFIPKFELPVPTRKGSGYQTPEVKANVDAGKTTSGGAPINLDVAGAITGLGDAIGTGARTFAVAGVVIGVVLVLGYSGVKRTLD